MSGQTQGKVRAPTEAQTGPPGERSAGSQQGKGGSVGLGRPPTPIVYAFRVAGSSPPCLPRHVPTFWQVGGASVPGRERGFTLIELLVVVAIISLLVGIMVPSLNRAREIVRRGICGVNLRNICTSIAIYAQVEEAYPQVPLNGAGWAVAIGTARDISPFDGALQGRNPTSTLFLLVREGYCGAKMFLCPSSREKHDDTRAADFWDFADGTRVSYALMNPYGSDQYFTQASGNVVLLADASPYFDPATGLRNSAAPADLSGNPDEATIRRGNSPNHLGDGQNAAVWGGSCVFRKRADCGSSDDNIYTRAVAAEGTDPAGDIPTPGGDGSAADQGPAGPYDTYAVP